MDQPNDSRWTPFLKRLSALGLALGFVGLCTWPYVGWFANPSLFDDDFQRVSSLRRSTLGETLFRPFNEHMAPLFETVSWLAWQASGHRLMLLPLAYQVFSYLAFGATLILLGLVALRELRSWISALICMAIFALSAVSAETVLWFSASSFQWSAAALLAGWYAAIRWSDTSSFSSEVGWMLGSAMACLASPAFSAIGFVAGPVVAIRCFCAVRPGRSRLSRVAISAVPLAGSLVFLGICHLFSYEQVLVTSVRQNLELSSGILATLQAPTAVLLPGLFGMSGIARHSPGWALVGVTLVGLSLATWAAVRSRQRPLILGSLAMMIASYLVTYAPRVRPGGLEIFEVQRYHLFPQIGFALLIATFFRPLIDRFDHSIHRGLLLAVAVAGSLLALHDAPMRAVSDREFRYPEQPAFLAAGERLQIVCEQRGITLEQAIHALEPIQAPWYPRKSTIHPVLYLFGDGPKEAKIADSEVRGVLIHSLSMTDREAIFGGLSVRIFRRSVDEDDATEAIATRYASALKMTPIGPNGYRAEGRGAWLEFEVGPEAGMARSLCLPDLHARNDVRICWAGEDGFWSSFRSVYARPIPGSSGESACFRLDDLPHWRPNFVHKMRLMFREWGEVSASPPRFLR